MTYTTIPDTTDTDYWDLASVDNVKRMRVFVPRDRELHRRLLRAQWDKIQARLPNKDRSHNYKLFESKS